MPLFVRIGIVIVVVGLMSLLTSCGSKNYNKDVNALVGQANQFLEQEAIITRSWRDEFVTVFTMENREKFPSNRKMLRPYAENQLRLLQEKEDLLLAAVAKLKQASAIAAANQKEKRFAELMAESLGKDVEIVRSFRKPMKMVLDETVTDAQLLKDSFAEAGQEAEMKAEERDALQSEAKMILENK